MKKFFLSVSLMAVFAWYATFHAQSVNQGQITAVANPEPKPKPVMRFLREDEEEGEDDFRRVPRTIPAPTSIPTPVANPVASPTVNPVGTPSAPSPQGMYKNGAYIGNPTDAYYGTLQVKAVVQGGKIADVVFLQHAQDQGTSIEINNYAMPILKNEAIRAQNAQVDIVSGATYTSEAFQISLASALAQAKN